MHGWLTFEQRMGIDAVEVGGMSGWRRHPELLARRHMQDLAAEPAITQQAIHLVVAEEAPQSELFPEPHGPRRMNACVGGERIGVEPGIPWIERKTSRAFVECQPRGAHGSMPPKHRYFSSR